MFSNIIESAVPYLLAALGGLLTEMAGALNIALEGLMLAGGFTVITITALTGNIFLGIFCALFVALVLAGIHSLLSFNWKGDHFVTGLAINLLVPGFIAMVSYKLYKTKGVIRLDSSFQEVLNYLMWAGKFFAFAAIPGLLFYLYKTRGGLRLRACGMKEELVISRGIPAFWVKTGAMVASGFFASLSGMLLVFRQGAFVPGISGGRGWIALVAIYLGKKNPLGVLGACLVFSISELLSHHLQGRLPISPSLLLAFPYLLTVLLMVIFKISQLVHKKALENLSANR